MSDPSLIQDVERYYTAKVRAHGATPAGVDWKDAASQGLRFEQLCAALQGIAAPTINDFGCGYGGLLDHLTGRLVDFRYRGYDISEDMLAEARGQHAGEPRALFTSELSDLEGGDVTLASGVFNVRLGHSAEEWRAYVLETIDAMVKLSSSAIAFNALTSHADPELMREDLFYADPTDLLDYCLRTHSRDVRLIHDYELYEFTVIVRLNRRPPVSDKGERAR